MERRRPRPHIRHAHWHTYKRGPRDGPHTVFLKWMPPIPVNATPDTLVPTVHAILPEPTGAMGEEAPAPPGIQAP